MWNSTSLAFMGTLDVSEPGCTSMAFRRGSRAFSQKSRGLRKHSNEHGRGGKCRSTDTSDALNSLGSIFRLFGSRRNKGVNDATY